MIKKFTYNQFRTMLKWPLEDKILRALMLIEFEIKESKKPCVACSWGKDSIVLLHLVRIICPNVHVVFHNTGVEYPETYVYRDLILSEWGIKNYSETLPIKSFWDCVSQYGYPKFRKMSKQKNRTSSPKCCYYLKEKPAIDFAKVNGIDCEFLGLQASESMVRRLSFFREGESFFSKKYNHKIVRPLMIWTDKDIWDYQKHNNIPYNSLYDKMKRNGCMPCTGFKNWKEVMLKANPNLYKIVAKKTGNPILSEWCK